MPEADDLMDEDGAAADLSPRAANPRLRCTIARENDDSAHRKTKGRGFREEKDSDRQRCLSLRDFESLGSDGGPGPQRSIEGWINLVTAVHEEAQEDDISNAFGDFGQIKSLHVNLDRLTGFVKEYAYLEYEKSKEAQNAIKAMNGAELLTQNVNVDWAFCNGPSAGSYRKKNMRFLCVNLGFCPATTTQGCILSDFEKIADFLRKAAHITSVLHRKYGKPHKDLCGSL